MVEEKPTIQEAMERDRQIPQRDTKEKGRRMERTTEEQVTEDESVGTTEFFLMEFESTMEGVGDRQKSSTE